VVRHVLARDRLADDVAVALVEEPERLHRACPPRHLIEAQVRGFVGDELHEPVSRGRIGDHDRVRRPVEPPAIAGELSQRDVRWCIGTEELIELAPDGVPFWERLVSFVEVVVGFGHALLVNGLWWRSGETGVRHNLHHFCG